MTRIPRAALLIGGLGLLPFLYAVMLILSPPDRWPTLGLVPATPDGGLILLERFGAVILGFMGGCLWGFAAAPGRAPSLILLGASAVPAALAFLAMRPDPALSCVWLAFGFAVLQAIDVAFRKSGVAPAWWLTLRLPLTAMVMACLLIGAIHG